MCIRDSVTIPQIRAMYGGDYSRKKNLVDYGFRLPAAMDNRPLTFDEFESLTPLAIYVSATPADYELEKMCIRDSLIPECVGSCGRVFCYGKSNKSVDPFRRQEFGLL